MRLINRTLQFLILTLVMSTFLASSKHVEVQSLFSTEAIFKLYDKNNDGQLSKEEAPQRTARFFARADSNNDNLLTKKELTAAIQAAKNLTDEAAEQRPIIENDARYEKAAEYLESKNGHALLVYENNKLVYEKYFNGHKRGSAHRLASGTKSFSGAMLVAAIDDGLLSLNEPLAATITEWKDDTEKSKITIRQLLSLTSGIHGGKIGVVLSYKNAINQAKVTAPPGTKFQYGPVPYQIFGEVMRRKLKEQNESVEDYLHRRVLDPIGLKPSLWRTDEDGNITLPSGALIRAEEWAKFGLLIANRGKHQGNQVLPANILKLCFEGSKTQPRYGLTFWLDPKSNKSNPLIMAAGAGKQKLYIYPAQNRVVVQFAEGRRYLEKDFLALLPKNNSN